MPDNHPSDTNGEIHPDAGSKRRSCCWWDIAAFVVFIVFIGVCVPQYIGVHRHAWNSRAKGMLRSIGSDQLAYQAENKNQLYGSIGALQEAELIPDVYTLGNMIENYSMTWQVSNFSTAPSDKFPYGLISKFTVIAWPRDTREGFLNTFAIAEDQVLRVYDPSGGASLVDVKTWDPIL